MTPIQKRIIETTILNTKRIPKTTESDSGCRTSLRIINLNMSDKTVEEIAKAIVRTGKINIQYKTAFSPDRCFTINSKTYNSPVIA
jgi:ribosomal protein S10